MSVYVKMLGPPELQLEGNARHAALSQGKTSALLYYLAYKGDWVSRDELLYLFWPDAPESQARKNLRQLLTTLRRLPYTEGLEAEALRLRWCVPNDVQRFENALGERAWARAVDGYRGELLEGHHPTSLPEFEDWLTAERRDLAAKWRVAALELAAELEAKGQGISASEVLKRLYRSDPFDEEALRFLLQSLRRSGQRVAALEAFQRFRESLHRELGGLPQGTTLKLVDEIQQDLAGISALTAVATEDEVLHNLPLQLTSLIGREAETARCLELLSSSCRLLTLVGPGGVGKTRLAFELAWQQLGRFKHGVWFVSLAAVSSPHLLAPTVIEALKVPLEGSTEPKVQLARYLREKEMLLLLDNFEQLVTAASFVTELLSACAKLKVLVTSREGLRVRGEQEYPVPPLALPRAGQPLTLEQLGEYAAINLFVERAAAVQPDFLVSAENASALVGICRQLDGLPLAIELAAVRIKLFSPRALLTRLTAGASSSLELLSHGVRGASGRHRALRDTVAWSYDLLSCKEQGLFNRLAVFVGGCDARAIEGVCNADGALPEAPKLLYSLVDKNLLRHFEKDSEPHFFMLKVIYDYALERLEASGEAQTIRGRHAAYFLALAEAAEPHLTGEQQTLWLARLEDVHDNLRAALNWTQQHGSGETAARFGAALWRFWLYHAHLSEGRGWLGRLAERSDLSVPLRAKVLNGAANLASHQGDLEVSRLLHEACLVLRRAQDDRLGIAGSLGNLGNVLLYEGDYMRATPMLEESLTLFRELGDENGVANALNALAFGAMDNGEFARAQGLLEETLVLRREQGNSWNLAATLNSLGNVALYQSAYERAAWFFTESLKVFQGIGDRGALATCRNNLALVALHQGDYTEARAIFKVSVQTFYELDNKQGLAESFEGLARLSSAVAQYERAARLWGSAEKLREVINAPLPLADQALYEADVMALRAQLDEASFAAAWWVGRTSSLRDTVLYALEVD